LKKHRFYTYSSLYALTYKNEWSDVHIQSQVTFAAAANQTYNFIKCTISRFRNLKTD